MKRLVLLLLCALSITAAPTRVSDTITTPVTGTSVSSTAPVTSISISWKAFTNADGSFPPGSTTLRLDANRSFSVNLEPTDSATGPAYYSVVYSLSDGNIVPSVWYVPTSASVLRVSQLIIPITVQSLNYSLTTAQLLCSVCSVNDVFYWDGTHVKNMTTAALASQLSLASSSNATSFESVPLAASTASEGQAYVYSSADSEWEPVAVPHWKKYTVSYSQLTGFNALTGTVTLFARANRQKVCGVSIFTTSAFAGAGITGTSVIVGDSNSTTSYYTPTPTSVNDNGASDSNVMGSAIGASNVQATFTAIGANLSALTAGVAEIDVCVANLP